MKTHILRLESHDDLTSALDKMGWAQAGRILLVWPQPNSALPARRVLARRLDLVIIQRKARTLGVQLALVTQDADVRFNARQLGIPAYPSLRQAQSAHWRVPRRFRQQALGVNPDANPADRGWDEGQRAAHLAGLRDERPSTSTSKLSPPLRLAIFSLGVLALLSLAAVLAPGAKIILRPQTRLQEIAFLVRADPTINKINLTGVVPAQRISVIVEGREILPTTGQIRAPVQPASGTVTFTNLTDQPVEVPAGSVIRATALQQDTADLRFATTRSGTLPAGAGKTLSLPVRALLPGSAGNLPAGRLLGLEDVALGTRLSVTNPMPTSGGADYTSLAPSEADHQRLAEKLHAALAQTALQELRASLADGDRLIEPSLRLSRTLEEIYSPSELQPADQLTLDLRLEYEAQFASSQDLIDLAAAVLDANLPEGFVPLPDSLEIENLEVPADETRQGQQKPPDTGSQGETNSLGDEAAAGAGAWLLAANRRLQAQLPESRAAQIALGLPPGEAIRRLETALPIEAPAQIIMQPVWWPRLPVLPFRIRFSGN